MIWGRGRRAKRRAAAAPRDVFPTFRDPETQARFDRDGFVVVDVFSPAEIEQLREDARRLDPPTRGFATSVEITDEAYRNRVHAVLSERFAAPAERLFVDHAMNLTAVAVKWPGDEGLKPVHQDWTFSDEARYRSVNLWAPLVDTTEHNGTLAVLPGSHRALDRLRPAPCFPSGYEDPVEGLRMEDLQLVPVRAGQAIALDLAVVHGSPPNRSEDPRVVVAANFLPRPSPISYYFCRDDELVRYSGVEADFFRRFDFRAEPTELDPPTPVPFAPQPLTSAELIARSREVAAGREPVTAR